MKIWFLGILAALGLLTSSPALAQYAAQAQTVTACGTAPNTPVVGQIYNQTMDQTGKLCTASSAAIAGSTSNATSGVATSSNNLPTVSYNYGFNGTTWDQLQVDGSKYLDVNCKTGCAGGSFNNNADGVATSSTNGQTAAWLYAWNGSTFDRLTDDASKNLNVKVNVALPAGTAPLGKVGIDQTTPGTTNAVSATNLPTTVDTNTGAAGASTIRVVLANPADPCFNSAKLYADFESTTSGGSIITAVSAKKAYVCSISIVTATAATVSIIEGTGSSVCTGGTLSGDFLNPGTTAANGASFAANGGLTIGSGNGTIFANATANQNTCVAFSGTPQVNVHVSYVQQ